MRVPAVACAVSLISEPIGALLVKLYDRDTKDALTDHPAYRLVHDEANEWTSAAELRESLTTDDLLRTDTAARATAFGQYRSMGAMTANEVRTARTGNLHPRVLSAFGRQRIWP